MTKFVVCVDGPCKGKVYPYGNMPAFRVTHAVNAPPSSLLAPDTIAYRVESHLLATSTIVYRVDEFAIRSATALTEYRVAYSGNVRPDKWSVIQVLIHADNVSDWTIRRDENAGAG